MMDLETAPSRLAARLGGELLSWKGGDAHIGGTVSIPELAAAYATPFYLYDELVLRRQFERLRACLPDAIDIFYSIKANPHPEVIKVFTQLGAGCEIASGGEYAIARRAGVPTEKIFFAGPGKSSDELKYVISHGIGEIHLESFEETETVSRLAQDHRTKVDVAIRVNPSAALGGGLMMAGQATVFGFEEESLPKVVEFVRQHSALHLRGIHVYTGTQILDADALAEHWRHAVEIARCFSKLTGQAVQSIDLGGGLGIPYFEQDKELDLRKLGKRATDLVGEARAEVLLGSARFIVEPGRFLVGPAGLYVTRVLSVKECRGTIFAVLDGGMNHHLAASGNLGQVVRRDFPIVNLSRTDTHAEATVVLTGPLCTPIDTMGRKVRMPLPQAGDLIGFLQSGAYGLTASPVRFLSHPSPAELLVRNGAAELITPRGIPFES